MRPLFGLPLLLFGLARADITNWTQNSPTSSPSARYAVGMAFRIGASRTILFGGASVSGMVTTYYNDTWLWNGTDWTSQSPSSSPGTRGGMGFATDTSRQATVLFGGVSLTGNNNDTWEWNGSNWSSLSPSSSPAARQYPMMVYDSSHNYTYLFGGNGASGYLNDTWRWNGNNWSSLSTTSSPSTREHGGMSYDSSRGRVMLFGGYDGNSLGQTWEWNGTDWTSLNPSSTPSTRSAPGMVYDVKRGVTVLFGGSTGPTAFSNDTWEWDGTNWSSRAPTSYPSTRAFAGAAYDTHNSRMVLFGGTGLLGANNETWYYSCTSGCSTSLRIYDLSATRERDGVTVRFRAGYDPELIRLTVVRLSGEQRGIVGSALGPALDATEQQFELHDPVLLTDARYLVEAQRLDGSVENFGPLVPSDAQRPLGACAAGRTRGAIVLGLMLFGLWCRRQVTYRR